MEMAMDKTAVITETAAFPARRTATATMTLEDYEETESADDDADFTLVQTSATRGKTGSGVEDFSMPFGVAVSPRSGNIVVCDNGNCRVHILSPTLHTYCAFGGKGARNGSFLYPYDVAINKDDRIFISDEGNHRVQVTDSFGHFMYAFGGEGSGPTQFRSPKGLAVDSDSGHVYVCDSHNHRVVVLTPGGQYVREYGNDNHVTRFPQCPAFVDVSTKSGRIAVSDTDGNITILARNGEILATVLESTPPHCLLARGIAWERTSGLLIAAHADNQGHLVVMREDGSLVSKLSPADRLYAPVGVTMTSSGRLVVTESGADRLHVMELPATF